MTIIGILFVSDLKTMFHYKNTHDNCPVKSQSRMDPNYEPSKILMRDLVAENLLNSAVRKQSCTSAQRTTYSQWIRTTCNPSTMHLTYSMTSGSGIGITPTNEDCVSHLSLERKRRQAQHKCLRDIVRTSKDKMGARTCAYRQKISCKFSDLF